MSFVSEASIARRSGARRRRATGPMRCLRRDARRRRRRSDSKAIFRRLMALKELIPSRGVVEEAAPPPPVNADRLFEDAADYILRLRTQVVILKQLVDFYGIREQRGE